MINLQLNISLPNELGKKLFYLENISKRSKEFYVEEAINQYLENLEDLEIAYEDMITPESEKKYYTSKQLDKIMESW